MAILGIDREIFVADEDFGITRNRHRTVDQFEIFKFREALRPLFDEKLPVAMVHETSLAEPARGTQFFIITIRDAVALYFNVCK